MKFYNDVQVYRDHSNAMQIIKEIIPTQWHRGWRLDSNYLKIQDWCSFFKWWLHLLSPLIFLNVLPAPVMHSCVVEEVNWRPLRYMSCLHQDEIYLMVTHFLKKLLPFKNLSTGKYLFSDMKCGLTKWNKDCPPACLAQCCVDSCLALMIQEGVSCLRKRN